MTWLFRLLGALPLRLNLGIGAALGWLAWFTSPRHRRLTRENLAQWASQQSQPMSKSMLNAVIAEQGRGISELAVLWTAPVQRLYRLVRDCEGWEHVEVAKSSGRAIIFVTPHLGCYDIAGRYVESRLPVTALYRPPKQKWLEPIMQAGRIRGEGQTASADGAGVRTLLRTLKAGGNIVILPDQVPGEGEGVWVPFFGRAAYTMTLLPRLAKSANAVVLFFYAERLSVGRGYRIRILPMPTDYVEDREAAARQTNAMVESLVNRAPTQYLWGYNRYKRPSGAPPPPDRPD